MGKHFSSLKLLLQTILIKLLELLYPLSDIIRRLFYNFWRGLLHFWLLFLRIATRIGQIIKILNLKMSMGIPLQLQFLLNNLFKILIITMIDQSSLFYLKTIQYILSSFAYPFKSSFDIGVSSSRYLLFIDLCHLNFF